MQNANKAPDANRSIRRRRRAVPGYERVFNQRASVMSPAPTRPVDDTSPSQIAIVDSAKGTFRLNAARAAAQN
jgi:hypothetical protein